MEQRDEVPDFWQNPEATEHVLSNQAAEIIHRGINHLWGKNFTESADINEEMSFQKTIVGETEITRFKLAIGYDLADDEELYSEERVLSGALEISKCKVDDDSLLDMLRDVYVNQIVSAKEAAGATEEDIEKDEEVNAAILGTYSAWDVVSYQIGLDSDDGVTTIRSYELKDMEGFVVWSSIGGATDESDYGPGASDNIPGKSAEMIRREDYFDIQAGLIRLNVPPALLY